jgi:hypothetical protein
VQNVSKKKKEKDRAKENVRPTGKRKYEMY